MSESSSSKDFFVIIGFFSVSHLIVLVSAVAFLVLKVYPFMSEQYITASFLEVSFLSIDFLMQHISTTPVISVPAGVNELGDWNIRYLFLSFCLRAILVSVSGIALLFRKKWGWILLLVTATLALIHALVWQIVYFQQLSVGSTLLFDAAYMLCLYALLSRKLKPATFSFR